MSQAPQPTGDRPLPGELKDEAAGCAHARAGSANERGVDQVKMEAPGSGASRQAGGPPNQGYSKYQKSLPPRFQRQQQVQRRVSSGPCRVGLNHRPRSGVVDPEMQRFLCRSSSSSSSSSGSSSTASPLKASCPPSHRVRRQDPQPSQALDLNKVGRFTSPAAWSDPHRCPSLTPAG